MVFFIIFLSTVLLVSPIRQSDIDGNVDEIVGMLTRVD